MSNGDDDVPLGGSERAGGMPDRGQPTGVPSSDAPRAQREVRRAEPVEVRKALPVTLEDQFKSALEVAYDNYKQLRADQEQAQKEELWYTQQKQRLLSQPAPKMPSFEEMFAQGPYGSPPAEPLTPEEQGYKFGHWLAYSAIAYPFALLSGKKNAAAWNAQEAAGQAMNALASGNRARASAAGVLWKDQNDNALKWGEKRLQYYEDIIKNRNTDITEKLDLAESMATYWKDKATADIAASGEWSKFIDHLSKMETVINNAHKVRAAHEMAIMTDLGLGPEMKAYVQQIYTNNPDLREGLQSQDPAIYMKAYDEGVKRLPFKKFHEAQLKKQEEEAREKEKGRQEGMDFPPPGSSRPAEQPGASPSASASPRPLSDADRARIADFARRLHQAEQTENP